MSQSTGAHSDESTRSVVLAAIWRSRWLVLLAALIAGLVGYLLSNSRPETYAAESRMVLEATQEFDPDGGQSGGDASRFIANQVAYLQTSDVLQRAVEGLRGVTVGELSEDLEVSSSGTSNEITVRTTAPTAQGAADRANAVRVAYEELVAQDVATTADDTARTSTDPLVSEQILIRARAYGDGVLASEAAVVPDDPESPNPWRDAALLAGLGALVAIGVALVRRPPAERSAWTSDADPVRVLGTVPMRMMRRGKAPAVDPADHALALVALDYARREHGGPILVTEVGRRGRAASVAYGMGVSAAGLGRRVLLVDADPEARELALRAGVPAPARSLASLGEGASREVQAEAVVRLPLEGSTDAALHLAQLGGDAGGPSDDVQLSATLGRLAGAFDLVLIQSGPVETDPLAFALVGQSAAVVAAVGTHDGPEQLDALRDRLEVAQRPLIGVVRTQLTRVGGRRGGTGGSSRDPARVTELVGTTPA